jgi:folate-binding protein YgfZ
MTGPYRLDRSLIRVSGPDTLAFLDNLLTQDMGLLTQQGVIYSALLSPPGKLLADFFVWSHSDGVVIDADQKRGPDLLRRLTMYKLRANVTVVDVSNELSVLASETPFPGAQQDPRHPALGFRTISAENAPPADWYDANRIAVAIPDLARDAAPEEVFALEALLEELNGVDFHKGCFVGQENVSRMKRRATTRKKFCPIVFDGAAPEYGAPITAGAAEIGNVRSGMPGRAIALVRLDRAFEAMDKGVALEAAGRPVKLDPPPWLLLPPREASA